MTNYSRGRNHEYAVRDALETDGYWCVRAAGSKGKADLVALKPGEVVLVQVKASSPQVSPAEREALFGMASATCTVPVVAYKPARRPITFRELTGVGPKEWRPWAPSGGVVGNT